MGLKICHVISSISRIGAGVSKAVRDLSEAQVRNGDTVTIATFYDKFTDIDRPKQKEISILAYPVIFNSIFGYSRPLKKALYDLVSSVDIIHMHGLWEYPSWVAGTAAQKHGTPYIMSPHGMLEPWGLQRNSWKKKVTGLLFEYNNLAQSHCLHACSEQEALNFRNYGYSGPIAIARLGLTFDELDHASIYGSRYPANCVQSKQLTDKKIVLFLSRLHEKKGLGCLIEAWKNVGLNYPDWHLIIAGGGDPAYVTKLHNKVQEAKLTDFVTFVGPIHGDDKWSLLKNSSLFVLPTFSENFGLVVIEALACGIPVITTTGSPWRDLHTEECGWWIDIGTQPLEQCLNRALALPEDQRIDMGKRGRRLVEAKYVIDKTAHTLQGVYKWMLNAERVPECVMNPVSKKQ